MASIASLLHTRFGVPHNVARLVCLYTHTNTRRHSLKRDPFAHLLRCIYTAQNADARAQGVEFGYPNGSPFRQCNKHGRTYGLVMSLGNLDAVTYAMKHGQEQGRYDRIVNNSGAHEYLYHAYDKPHGMGNSPAYAWLSWRGVHCGEFRKGRQ